MRIVKPGESEKPAVTIVDMKTAIPAHETPTVSIMIVGCKSGALYIGQHEGKEQLSHSLCIHAADMLHKNALTLIAQQDDQRIQPVGTTLENLGLHRPGQA